TTIDLYVNAFYKQIYDYCDKYNWRTTGHINAEGGGVNQIKNHGDYFKVAEYLHYGGCDQLTEDVRPDGIEDMWNQEANPYVGMKDDMILASKFASSAAHLLGKPRVLVESYGTSSWDIRMGSAKRVTDYLISTGCDLFVPHSFNISEDSYRKGDHPAAFNYQPYYKHWKKLADYCGRLCAVMNAHSGVLVPEVLYFYPAKTFHAEMQPSHSNIADVIGRYLMHSADCLYRQQLDYELAGEDMILGGSIVNNKIQIKDEQFKVLLLGATTCVSKKFAEFVRDYYNAGGAILAMLSLPYKEENTGESEEVNSIFEGIFGISPVENANLLKDKKINEFKLIESSNTAGGKAIFIQAPMLIPYHGAFYPAFEEAFRKLIPLENRDSLLWRDEESKKHPAYVMVTHKTIGEKEFYFMANTGRGIDYENVKVILDVAPKRVEIWDILTGEIKESFDFGLKGGKIVFNLDFPENKSYLYVIEPLKETEEQFDKSASLVAHPKPSQSIELGPTWNCKMQDPNGAMLYLDWHSSYQVEAGDAWGYRGVRTFDHKFHVKDVDTIKPVKLVIEGLVGDYGWAKDTIDMPKGGDRAHFMFPGNLVISLNGKNLRHHFDFNVEYLDAYWIVIDISNALVEGENEVKMVCTTRNHGTFHVVNDPWRLIGNFEADESGNVPKLQKPRYKIELGDITTQGFPRYHGGLSYIQDVDLPGDIEGKAVELAIEGTTDCIEVHVNGKLVDVLWHEWKVDITSEIKPGAENQIEIVYYGIAQNMLQTNIKEQGITGKVFINIF
ncbi:MAG: hypothetical protein ACFFCS_27735, partial [Candidatus Hodarchaeota archaeon]